MSRTHSHVPQLPFLLLPTLTLPCGSHAPRAGIAPVPGKTRTASVRLTTSHCKPASKPLSCRPPTLPTCAHFQASQTLSYGRAVVIPLPATEVFPLVHCNLLARHTDVCVYADQSCFVCAGGVVWLHKHVFPIVDRKSLRLLPTPYFLLSMRILSARRKFYTDPLAVLST
jgi:hypothetical protein